MIQNYDLVIVGAGFTGLSAAFNASRRGKKVLVIEKESSVGGLASTFLFSDGSEIEKYYHHWFSHDEYIVNMAKKISIDDQIITLPSKTGMFYNKRIWNLSSPKDLLMFTPLSFLDRIRLGMLVFLVHLVRDWKKIEHLSIREWLEPMVGKRVYKLVWEPLVNSKFSEFSEDVSAVWMWKKLALRGSTRSKNGKEELSYIKGGFSNFAEAMKDNIIANGGEFLLKHSVLGVNTRDNIIESIVLNSNDIVCGKNFLFTPSFKIIQEIFHESSYHEWLHEISRIKYLANICLVLKLRESLSDTYWLNVNDPGFPFVGVIEHTNFDTENDYGSNHIAYLSKYLSQNEKSWSMNDKDYFNYAIDHLQKMFPDFQRSSVLEWKIWRTEYAQPITTKDYSKIVPNTEMPYKNGWIATMAQIYPEDRGTNYALRDGELVVNTIYANENY